MKLPDWLSRFTGEKRNHNPLENPTTPLSAATLDTFGASRKSASGVAVTPENSLETVSVFAAVRLIAGTLATLPLITYGRSAEGKERAPEHQVYALLHDRPNPEQSAFTWREQMAAHLLIYGNAYSEIERDGAGRPVALWPLMPTSVRWERIGGQKVYLVRVNGQDVPLAPDNVLHIPGFSLNGHDGLIPTHVGRNAIGMARATEDYGASFFANGAQPSGILTTPNTLGEEALASLRAGWAASHGGLTNAQRVAILDGGLTWTSLGVPPEHAQFLETRKFSVTEVARLFNLPPFLIGDLERATFSNIEHQAIQYVQHCVEPWTRRIEQELNYKLFADRSHFCEHVLEGLLRGDSAARAEFYTKMAALGVYSPNEIREMEGRNRVEGGDVRFYPSNNMTPLGASPEQAA